MPKTYIVDGKQYVVPDNATLDDVATYVRSQGGGPKQPSVWEAANKPIGKDYAEWTRGQVVKGASYLPESVRGPAAYAGNVLTALPASAVEMGRRVSTSPLGMATTGLGGLLQYLRALPEASTTLKGLIAALETGTGGAFGAQGAKEAATPRQKGETGLQEFERRVGGTGQAILGMAPVAHAAAGVPEAAGRGTKTAAREMVGAGESQVSRARAEFETRQAERRTAYEQKVRDTLAEHTRTRAEKRSAYEQKYADRKAEFDARQAEREAAYEAKRAETAAKHQEELAAAKRGYGESVSQAERAKIRESVLETKKRSYTELKERLSKEATDNAVRAEKSERGSLDQRFDSLRQQVGDAEVKVPVGDAIKEGREMLMGEPNSLKVFNDITKRFVVPGAGIDTGGMVEPLFRETMPFNEARTHYTALGEARVGDIPWNVAKALEHVQNAFDSGIKRTIDMKMGAQGVEAYGTLKGDWADYLRTWRDLRPLNKGGSPLARVIALTNAPLTKGGMPVYRSTADMLLGKTGERAPYLLARKRAFGADPTAVARLQRADAQLRSLPKTYGRIPAVKRPEFPKYAAPPQPKAETFEPPTAPKSERYEVPPEPERQTFDPEKFRRMKAEEKAEYLKTLSPWELAASAYAIEEIMRGRPPWSLTYPVVKRAAGEALSRPSVLDWLSQGP